MREGPADGTLRVLIVEDNAADLWRARSALESALAVRFEVREATRLQEALAVLASAAQDAVLLDLGLPDSQGLSSFTTLHARHRLVPIVVMSGLDDESSALDAVRLGAQDYLVKGKFDDELLTRSIRHAVERQHLLGQVERSLTYVRRLLLETRELPGATGRRDPVAICSWCKRIRDEGGRWQTLDELFADPANVPITALTCPSCRERIEPA
jgi:PleD family two-component response regulator